MTTVQVDWIEANQAHLAAAVVEVRAHIERFLGHSHASSEPTDSDDFRALGAPGRSALDVIVDELGLTDFERLALVLAAAVELDGALPDLLAEANRDSTRGFATFAVALAALPGAHWSALTPDRPLRRWHLIEVDASVSLTRARVRIDERVLHFLTGLDTHDAVLAGIMREMRAERGSLPASHEALVDVLADLWVRERVESPTVQLCGDDRDANLAVAAALVSALGSHRFWVVSAAELPERAADLEALARRFEREALLGGAPIVIDAHTEDDGPSPSAAERLVGLLGMGVLVTGHRRGAYGADAVVVDVPRSTFSERRAQWQCVLDGTEVDSALVDRVAAQFPLSGPAMRGAALEAEVFGGLEAGLWQTCRNRSRAAPGGMAQRIEPQASWADLALPEDALDALRAIVRQARHRAIVHDEWGFTGADGRGSGISALFAGPSGTGKTLAAEVIATELELDLYRVDLSQVVSKYIGETEKNLARAFSGAERSGSVLLFDEADALFGKRSQVKDSHDRYANVEVSYLLQRMEQYRGLAILTTNNRTSLDQAFLRRLRFIVNFPFPDIAQRLEIWRRVFPAGVPTAGLDHEQLARLDMAGGHIRNIAIHGAFYAAAEGSPVRMTHLLQGARAEYDKLERALSPHEIEGWS